MKRWLLVLGVAVLVLLAGCGSTVPLGGNGVPVDDRSTSDSAGGAGVRGGGSGADAKGVSQGSVASVQLSPRGADAALASEQMRIIYFDYDSYAIRPEFQSVLEAHARALMADGTRKVQLEGHTDSRGGREYNLSLGQRRAEAVRRALVALGVRDAQMEAVSFGKEKPAVVEDSDVAMQKNRRVELNYQ